MNRDTPYSHSFNELLTGKVFFECKTSEDNLNKKVFTLINAYIRDNSVVEILNVVSKYLLFAPIYQSKEESDKYQDPSYVKGLLLKYLVVLIYLYLNPVFNEKTQDEDLEKFRQGINIKDLINLEKDDKSFYGELLSDKSKLKEKDIITYLKKIHKDQTDKKIAKDAKTIIKLIGLKYSYFMMQPKLKYYIKNRNQTKLELIICNQLVNNVFENFNFEIIDEDEFSNNISEDKKKNKNTYRKCVTFMGIFIKDLINYLKENQTVNDLSFLSSRNRINMATLDKEFKFSSFVNFISTDNKLLRDKISTFRFKFNNQIYRFDNSDCLITKINDSN